MLSTIIRISTKKFRRLNHLVNNKYFIQTLIKNVMSIYKLINSKKTNSVILNYDFKSNELFWYQQLVMKVLEKK